MLFLEGNCTVQNVNVNMKNVKFAFLPTTLMQHMGKKLFVIFRLITGSKVEKTTYSTLGQRRWNNISDRTIRNSLRHEGFVKSEKELKKAGDSCFIETSKDLTLRNYKD